MLRWILVLGVCALLAAALGFFILAGVFALVARLMVLLFLAALVIGVVSHVMRSGPAIRWEGEQRRIEQ